MAGCQQRTTVHQPSRRVNWTHTACSSVWPTVGRRQTPQSNGSRWTHASKPANSHPGS